MYRPAVYLDTSVPSALFDVRAPERQALTREFWEMHLPDFEAKVSTFVLQEIEQTPDLGRRAKMLELVAPMPVLPFDEEARLLGIEYVRREVFSEKNAGDAIHVAIATAHGVPYLASWNFKHLVRVVIRREINLVNSLMGYGPLEIVAPPEL